MNKWKGDIFRTEEKSHVKMETRLHIVSDIFGEFVNFSFDWKEMKTLGIILPARMEDGYLMPTTSVHVITYPLLN